MTLRQLIKLLRRYPKKATVQVQTLSPRITLCVDQDNNWIVRFEPIQPTQQPQSKTEN